MNVNACRSKWMLAAVASATVLALTACSTDAGGAGQATSGTAGGGGQFEVFSFWTSGSESEALQVLIDQYQSAHPGVKVINGAVSGGGGANATQVLQSRIAGGDIPDTWQSGPGYSQGTYVDAGLTADLTQVYKDEGWLDVMPSGMVDSLSASGKTYGVLTGIHRQNVLFSNLHVLKKVGVTLPVNPTWDEFKAAVQKAAAAGVTPICSGDKDIFASASLIERALLMRLGAADLQKLTAGTLSWSDPRVKTALGDYSFILDNTNSDHAALTWDQAVAKMAAGDCAFNSFSDSAPGELHKAGLTDNVDFGYMTYPGTEGVFLAVGDDFVVNSKAADPTRALDWVRTIGSKEGQLGFNKIKGSIPFRTDVDVTQLSPYQQMSAADYKKDAIVLTMTFGQSVTPDIEQALYDATTLYNNDRDADAFVKAMNDAYAKR